MNTPFDIFSYVRQAQQTKRKKWKRAQTLINTTKNRKYPTAQQCALPHQNIFYIHKKRKIILRVYYTFKQQQIWPKQRTVPRLGKTLEFRAKFRANISRKK